MPYPYSRLPSVAAESRKHAASLRGVAYLFEHAEIYTLFFQQIFYALGKQHVLKIAVNRAPHQKFGGHIECRPFTCESAAAFGKLFARFLHYGTSHSLVQLRRAQFA